MLKEFRDVFIPNLIKFRKQQFRLKFFRRCIKLREDNLRKGEMSVCCDFASAVLLGGLENVACGSRSYCYNEVFVARFNKEEISNGGENILTWKTVVFFFLGSSTGKCKENDHVAHDVNLKEFCRYMNETYGIEVAHLHHDQCAGQYMNWVVAASTKNTGRYKCEITRAFNEVSLSLFNKWLKHVSL